MGGSFKQCRNKTQSSLPHHHPQREGRHRMLYFNIQRTEKYSIANAISHVLILTAEGDDISM